MIKNYFKTGWRYLTKHKLFSFIHVFCLTIGITFTMVVGVYVLHQYNINRSLRDVENQYIVKSNWKSGELGLDITTLGPLAKTLREEYPSLVADYYRYNPVNNVVSAGNKHFVEDIAIGDTSFIRMYGFPVRYGNTDRPFPNNHSAVITESMALKLYGKVDAINEIISVHSTVQGAKQDYHVSAVIADIPFNSVTHLIGDNYSVFVPTEGNMYYGFEDPASGWDNPFEIGMIQLQPGVTPADLVVPCQEVLAKYTPENIQQNLTVELAPVKDYYLNDNGGAARRMITILSLSALFILVMAVINFINISIVTSSQRLKEIGLRKVFGGAKQQLIIQFLGEALLLTALAALLSLPLYQLLRPVFNEILNTQLDSVFDFRWTTYAGLSALVLVTGLLAGIYPAFRLSSSPVTAAVKGKIDSAIGNLTLRKTMLTVQFTLGIAVFIGTLIVSRQVDYIFSKDIGYSKDQVMVITAFPKQWDAAGVKKMMDVKHALTELAAVESASLSFEVPDNRPPNAFGFMLATGDSPQTMIQSIGVDQDYAQTFGMTVLAGSCFAQSGGHIPNQVVLNESAVKALGLTPETAVNQKLRPASSGSEVTIAGVVKDYNYSSLQEQIKPLAFFHVQDWLSYRFLSLKLRGANIAETIPLIKQQWEKLVPDAPFEFSFMDDQFAALYQSELQLKRAADVATALNFLIIALGIFGIVSFTLTKRSKEIAVRKVLGAELRHLTLLFVKDYTRLIILANLIAWPITYWVANNWLEGYAYRITQGLGAYLLVCLLVFVLAYGLIVGLCAKANRANPVESLRDE